MSKHPVVDVLRARAGELFDRARAETTDEVARLSGRGADWIDEAGQLLGDAAVTIATRLTAAAGSGSTTRCPR